MYVALLQLWIQQFQFVIMTCTLNLNELLPFDDVMFCEWVDTTIKFNLNLLDVH